MKQSKFEEKEITFSKKSQEKNLFQYLAKKMIRLYVSDVYYIRFA